MEQLAGRQPQPAAVMIGRSERQRVGANRVGPEEHSLSLKTLHQRAADHARASPTPVWPAGALRILEPDGIKHIVYVMAKPALPGEMRAVINAAAATAGLASGFGALFPPCFLLTSSAVTSMVIELARLSGFSLSRDRALKIATALLSGSLWARTGMSVVSRVLVLNPCSAAFAIGTTAATSAAVVHFGGEAVARVFLAANKREVGGELVKCALHALADHHLPRSK